MDIKIAKRIIGEKVKHGGNTYILTACILRKNPDDGKYYYQAELHELKANCVHIVALDAVEEVQGT